MKATKKLLATVVNGNVEFTTENFDEIMQAVLITAGSVQGNIQKAIDFAIRHAHQHDNNFSLITKLMNYVCRHKYGEGIRSKTMQEYIEAIVNGAKWQKISKGGVTSFEFKKVSKKAKVVYQLGRLDDYDWYRHNKKGMAVALDLKAMLESQLKRWIAAENSDKDVELKDRELNDQLAEQVQGMLDSIAKADESQPTPKRKDKVAA